MTNPTKSTYDALNRAYDHFNKRLFSGQLPPCLITMQRKAKAYGYFAGGRFGSKDGGEVTDEIALNPSHFKARTDEQSLSTLAHEMAHLWQHHFGKPSRSGYHNKEWAEKMHDIGLHPSDTGQPGGKETGQSCSHYIIEGGPYARAYADLAGKGFQALYVELWDDAEAKKKRKAKAASKTKYTCPDCDAHAWAKPGTRLICGECEILMLSDNDDEEGGE
ncbi:sprT domain-containing protein [Sinorhizobium meliloti]|uniref:SprT-like domain-containing protein n=1 Tax=Rhizobium meliloti TaxID=382 RepID=UPI00129598DA|nr:SprT-like domain-containing protein [Sinorhizobium meliloti]MQW45316.1 sprT domain-containing protein [Sinorhizobium meliloti]